MPQYNPFDRIDRFPPNQFALEEVMTGGEIGAYDSVFFDGVDGFSFINDETNSDWIKFASGKTREHIIETLGVMKFLTQTKVKFVIVQRHDDRSYALYLLQPVGNTNKVDGAFVLTKNISSIIKMLGMKTGKPTMKIKNSPKEVYSVYYHKTIPRFPLENVDITYCGNCRKSDVTFDRPAEPEPEEEEEPSEEPTFIEKYKYYLAAGGIGVGSLIAFLLYSYGRK